MWATTFLVAFWLTITPPYNLITPTTDVFILEFSRTMSTVGIFVTGNYTITDMNGNNIPIQDIEIVNELDGISTPGTTLVALIVPKIQYKTSYTVTVRNLRDINNNLIDPARSTAWHYNNGFAPNLEQSPKLITK